MSTKKIYVASSWRNPYYAEVLAFLRQSYECYDFKQPFSGGPKPPEGAKPDGFRWTDVAPTFHNKHVEALPLYRDMLRNKISQDAFSADFGAMKWADTCVLVLPSGRSAHVEAGWMAGSGRRLVVYMPKHLEKCKTCFGDGKVVSESTEGYFHHVCPKCGGEKVDLAWNFEPELMYLVGGKPDLICFDYAELKTQLDRPGPTREGFFWSPEVQKTYPMLTNALYPAELEALHDPDLE